MSDDISDGPWSLSQGECDGKPLFARINNGAARVARDPRYAQRVGVAVPIRAPNGNGFPRPEEAIQLDAIEDQLVDALTAEGTSIFVLAVTTAGTREFVFYTSDAAASRSRLERLYPTFDSHAPQHVIEDDPEWDVYEQFADAGPT